MTSAFKPDLWFPLVLPGAETAALERAALHSPEPVGLGTGGVESLRSFLLRVADAHCVGTGTLLRFMGQRHAAFRCGQNVKMPVFTQSRICGAGESAKVWASAAELVTGRKTLERLTLLPIHHILPFSSAMSQRRKWCPLCVSELSEYTEVYEPLLWCLQAVDACPKHGILLVEDCGCGGMASRPPWERKAHPGVCPYCSRALTSKMETASVSATAMAVREAELAVDLLFLGQQGLIGATAPAAFVAFLHSAANQLDSGGRKAFARRLGCSPGQLKGWMDGRHKLTLRNALNAIATLGASAEGAFVSGAYTPGNISATAGTSSRTKRTRQRTAVDWSKRLAILVEARQSEPPESLGSVGKKLNVSTRTLREKWPDHCRAVAERYAHWKRSADDKALEERVRQLREVATKLALSGIRPTRRRILETACMTAWKGLKKTVADIAAEATATWANRKGGD